MPTTTPPSLDKQETINDVYRAPTSEPIVGGANNEQLLLEQNYNMLDWFKKCVRNYVNFSGRARRKEFWYFTLMQYILLVIAAIIDTVIFDSSVGLFYVIVALGLFLPSLAVTIRRLHDTSRSGWWILISLIPIIGTKIILVFLASDTKYEMNQWGAPAKLAGS